MFVGVIFRLSQVWKENAGEAVKLVKSNKLRSFLTIVIISIGITSLMGVLTATDALKRAILVNFEKTGITSFSISPLELSVQSAKKGTRTINPNIILYRQAIAFKEQFGKYGRSSVFAPLGSMPIKYESRTLSNPTVNVVAADDDYLYYRGATLVCGKRFSENDLNSAAFVCIVGEEIVKSLFKDEEPLGKYISVAGIKYEIIGRIAKVGNSFGASIDNEILIPTSNARINLVPNTISYNIGVMPNVFSYKADNIFIYDMAEYIFRAIRRLTPSDESDFAITRSDAMLKEISEMTDTVTMVALIIGLVTLLGAAVGLMNIMLVSVKERTREIGIRKAVGASGRCIKAQFLLESLFVSELGCLFGVVAGIIIGNIVAMLMGAGFVIPWAWISFAVIVCFAVGILSGYVPAVRAACMEPVEALRCE